MNPYTLVKIAFIALLAIYIACALVHPADAMGRCENDSNWSMEEFCGYWYEWAGEGPLLMEILEGGCNQKIRYHARDPVDRDVEDLWNGFDGDCSERAVLLAAMLDFLDIEYQIMLVTLRERGTHMCIRTDYGYSGMNGLWDYVETMKEVKNVF